MKSGIEGRNNVDRGLMNADLKKVSMKSGLEGRNNRGRSFESLSTGLVSMKSGLEGRNNTPNGSARRSSISVSQ